MFDRSRKKNNSNNNIHGWASRPRKIRIVFFCHFLFITLKIVVILAYPQYLLFFILHIRCTHYICLCQSTSHIPDSYVNDPTKHGSHWEGNLQIWLIHMGTTLKTQKDVFFSSIFQIQMNICSFKSIDKIDPFRCKIWGINWAI